MPFQRPQLISALSLLASLIIAGQLVMIALTGEAACLNSGCRVIAGFTAVSTLHMNLIGLVFFQGVFWLSFLNRRQADGNGLLLATLLLSGMAAEGVLISYQLMVAATFCSYCLILFGLVLALNLMNGHRQLLTSLTVLAATLLTFFLLRFEPSLLIADQRPLIQGTFASRTCTAPSKEMYLFFSADCPHCHKVITALENCNSCDFHFNPVEDLGNFQLENIERQPSYNPELNRLLLQLLNIDTIPVLLEKLPTGYSIIRGEQQIITYIEQACYREEPVLFLEQSSMAPQEGMPNSPAGECLMTIECDEKQP